jgi:hypothetical protein
MARRKIASFVISRATGCQEYGDLVALSTVRVIKEQDFGLKDDVLRIVDFEDLLLPKYDDLPPQDQRSHIDPIIS